MFSLSDFFYYFFMKIILRKQELTIFVKIIDTALEISHEFLYFGLKLPFYHLILWGTYIYIYDESLGKAQETLIPNSVRF